jgi:hypothetical protein
MNLQAVSRVVLLSILVGTSQSTGQTAECTYLFERLERCPKNEIRCVKFGSTPMSGWELTVNTTTRWSISGTRTPLNLQAIALRELSVEEVEKIRRLAKRLPDSARTGREPGTIGSGFFSVKTLKWIGAG